MITSAVNRQQAVRDLLRLTLWEKTLMRVASTNSMSSDLQALIQPVGGTEGNRDASI